MLGLEELLDRRPAALSGGQRQRVAMGRAIVREPKAFLMDEPLSNLDAKLRVSMRAQLASLHARLGTTTIYVTHDQVEAMTLGQRVAVMRDGRILQVDTPQLLYAEPVEPLRRGLHRLAGDEPRRGRDLGRHGSSSPASGSRSRRRTGRPNIAVACHRRHPARGVRGRGARRRVAAADRGAGRRRRGSRPRHARDLPDRRAAGGRRRRARGRGRRRRAHADRPGALHGARSIPRARRAPAGCCGSRSTRRASTSSTRTAGCACRPPAPGRSQRPLPRPTAAVLALACAAACASVTAAPARPAVPLARLAGETVMSPLTGPPSATFLARVRAGELGGVILVGHWQSNAAMAAVTRQLQAAACSAGEPLLIGVDQEGGRRAAPAVGAAVRHARRARPARRRRAGRAGGRSRGRRAAPGAGSTSTSPRSRTRSRRRRASSAAAPSRGTRRSSAASRPPSSRACRRPASPRRRSTSPVSARRR